MFKTGYSYFQRELEVNARANAYEQKCSSLAGHIERKHLAESTQKYILIDSPFLFKEESYYQVNKTHRTTNLACFLKLIKPIRFQVK